MMPAMMGRGQPLRLEGNVKPVKGQPRPGMEEGEAKFLLGKAVKDVPGLDRRTIFAKWMTSKSNEWFAPAYANRLWAHLMGHGIVHPVDDFSQANKPANPELLKYLSDEFVRSDFDINHLGSVRLAKKAKEAGVPRFLFSSSCSTYGSGESCRPARASFVGWRGAAEPHERPGRDALSDRGARG